MEVKEKSFPKDMSVVFVQSKTFPDGIQEAFDTLKSRVGHIKRVSYFGISNPEGGQGIVYRAAAATMPEVDAEALGLGKLNIKGGNYYSVKLTDISKNINLISEAFDLILSKSNIDPNGHCIEVYDHFGSDSVECIVRKVD
ncbi:transcriptional regulator [Algoriphagus sp. Y33]|uniref:transcriptional regulator n=1 Tax=Algoriphagus sp. Y33 TaxID=2772483 RepID=UPI0017876948|nr:transcriptional regulator [Algoriphagus sp. Y33]